MHRWNTQKMQLESSEYLRKTTGFLHKQLEKNCLGELLWTSIRRKFGKNWRNLEVQTILLNTYPPKLIATILDALREQLKENDQLNTVEEIAGPVTEIFVEYDQILKDGGGF